MWRRESERFRMFSGIKLKEFRILAEFANHTYDREPFLESTKYSRYKPRLQERLGNLFKGLLEKEGNERPQLSGVGASM
jgi:hypothetical protein